MGYDIPNSGVSAPTQETADTMGDGLKLLRNATATGQWMQWGGGVGTFIVAGTFGGATVSLQMLGPDGSTPINVGDDVSLTTVGAGGFFLPACQVRAAVSGGSPSGLFAVAAG